MPSKPSVVTSSDVSFVTVTEKSADVDAEPSETVTVITVSYTHLTLPTKRIV